MSRDEPSDVDRICHYLERIANAYERMATIAEAKKAAPAAARPADDGETKEKKPKGDILTVTDTVAKFGAVTDSAGNQKLTTKKKPFWKLALSNGFEAMVFRESWAAICSEAYCSGAQLEVDYTKDGKYNNIEKVKVGSGASSATPARAARPDVGEGDPF